MSAEELLTPRAATEVVIRQERPPLDRPDQLADEIASHLSNDASGLTTKLGLKPVDYSAEIVQSGILLKFEGRVGQIEATVCCDGSLKVSVNGKTQGESPDVEFAVSYLKKLISGKGLNKFEPTSSDDASVLPLQNERETKAAFKRRFEYGVHGHKDPADEEDEREWANRKEEEETPQKSPKIQEEEEEEPTQLD